jgi:co-chaperonin GroES (HSP10)
MAGIAEIPYWTEKNLPKESYESTFPRRPVLDRIIVREIPIEEYYEQPKGVDIALDNSNIKERSDRGEVVSISRRVAAEGEIVVGDIVFFDEFALCDPVFLNPAHKHRSDLPKYWQMRSSDLKGVLCA